MINWNLSKQHTGFLALAMGFWIIGDLATTWAFLSIGHGEGNPLFLWLSIESFWIAVLVKLFAGLAIILIINQHVKWSECVCMLHRNIKAFHLIAFFFWLGFSVSISNLAGIIFGGN